MEQPEEKKNVLKCNIKDIVFHKAFVSKENLPAIYNALHPEDQNDYAIDDFEITSLVTDLTNGIRNDLSFCNLKTNVMTFIEAESSWKKSHLVRYRKYVLFAISDFARKYLDKDEYSYFDNEVYVFSTGLNDNPKQFYRMFDGIDKTFKDGFDIVNLNVQVYTRKHNNVPKNTVIDEYFRFCEKQREIMKKYKRTRETAKILVEECIQEGIFAEFFKKNKEEVMTNIEEVFNQTQATERFGQERYQAGIKKGRMDQANEAYEKALKYEIPEDIARKISGIEE